MTAIIAIKDGKRIMVGADSITTAENEAWAINHKSNYKICRVNGSPNCVIGMSGDCDRIHVVKNIENLLDGKDDISYSYLVNRVMPKIYNALKDYNYVKEGRDHDQIGASIILATPTHLYKINSYGIVIECTSAAIIGSGTDMLICKYLDVRDKKISLEDKVSSCLKHAITYGASIGYPIVMLENNKEKDYIIINK